MIKTIVKTSFDLEYLIVLSILYFGKYSDTFCGVCVTKNQIQTNEFSTSICYTHQTQTDDTQTHYFVVPAVISYVVPNWLFAEMVPEVSTHGPTIFKMSAVNLDANWLKLTLQILTPGPESTPHHRRCTAQISAQAGPRQHTPTSVWVKN